MDHKSLLHKALQLAQDSPDPSTQNAALLVNDKGVILCWDFNCFPAGIDYNTDRWTRPTKYIFVEHAERNVIYRAAKLGIKTDGLIMICVFFACPDCARAIIQSGIKKCIGHSKNTTNPKWIKSIKIGMDMLKEANVEIELLGIHTGIILKRDGKEIEF